MNHRLIFSNAQLTIMGMGVILSVFLCLGVEGWAQFTPPEPPTLPKEVFQSPNCHPPGIQRSIFPPS